MQGECMCGGGTPTNMYIGRQFHTGQMHGKRPRMSNPKMSNPRMSNPKSNPKSNAKMSNRVLIRTVPGEST